MKSFIASVRARLQRWLDEAVLRSVTWIQDERRDLRGVSVDRDGLVAIIGREHYDETRRLYPIRAVSDLRRVLALEGVDSQSVAVIGDLKAEKREVVIFTINPALDLTQSRALVVIPETLLFQYQISDPEIRVVDRRGVRYFVAPSGVSQLAGGLINNVAAFAVAVGATGSAVRDITEDTLVVLLRKGLRTIPLRVWPSLLTATAKSRGVLTARRLSILSAVVVASYLCALSIYYPTATNLRERELAALGEQVDALLIKQREVDRRSAEYALAVQKLRERQPAVDAWRVAGAIWKSGGRLTGFQFDGGQLTINGSAKNATDALRVVSELPGVSGAKFTSPVRQDGAEQDFSIGLTLETEVVGRD